MHRSKTPFDCVYGEGVELFKKRHWQQAKDAFSHALSVKPKHISALLYRSKCSVMLGEDGVPDAEKAIMLEDTKNAYKGVLQKAEALYAMGKFEFALLYFHSGFCRRPDVLEFKQGVHKAEAAIYDSLRTPHECRRMTHGALSAGGLSALSKRMQSALKHQDAQGEQPETDEPATQKKGDDQQVDLEPVRRLEPGEAELQALAYPPPAVVLPQQQEQIDAQLEEERAANHKLTLQSKRSPSPRSYGAGVSPTHQRRTPVGGTPPRSGGKLDSSFCSTPRTPRSPKSPGSLFSSPSPPASPAPVMPTPLLSSGSHLEKDNDVQLMGKMTSKLMPEMRTDEKFLQELLMSDICSSASTWGQPILASTQDRGGRHCGSGGVPCSSAQAYKKRPPWCGKPRKKKVEVWGQEKPRTHSSNSKHKKTKKGQSPPSPSSSFVFNSPYAEESLYDIGRRLRNENIEYSDSSDELSYSGGQQSIKHDSTNPGNNSSVPLLDTVHEIKQLVSRTIRYLDARKQFWLQNAVQGGKGTEDTSREIKPFSCIRVPDTISWKAKKRSPPKAPKPPTTKPPRHCTTPPIVNHLYPKPPSPTSHCKKPSNRFVVYNNGESAVPIMPPEHSGCKHTHNNKKGNNQKNKKNTKLAKYGAINNNKNTWSASKSKQQQQQHQLSLSGCPLDMSNASASYYRRRIHNHLASCDVFSKKMDLSSLADFRCVIPYTANPATSFQDVSGTSYATTAKNQTLQGTSLSRLLRGVNRYCSNNPSSSHSQTSSRLTDSTDDAPTGKLRELSDSITKEMEEEYSHESFEASTQYSPLGKSQHTLDGSFEDETTSASDKEEEEEEEQHPDEETSSETGTEEEASSSAPNSDAEEEESVRNTTGESDTSSDFSDD